VAFYQVPTFPLLRVSQGTTARATRLRYASPTIWTSVDGNNYAQRNEWSGLELETSDYKTQVI
jgi:hypothetical protein